jgi:hypothetical protein
MGVLFATVVRAQPGPLSGGEHGEVYRGPGFSFSLPAHWNIVLDEIAGGQGVRGERGTARGKSDYGV